MNFLKRSTILCNERIEFLNFCCLANIWKLTSSGVSGIVIVAGKGSIALAMLDT